MDINKILKSDYLDILFDGRNKTYGGYELRKKYPKRMRNAAMLLFGAALVLSAYPIIAGILGKGMIKAQPISMKVVELQVPPPIDRTKPEPRPLPEVPQPPVKPTVKLPEPVIKEDNMVAEQDKFTGKPDEKATVGLVAAVGDPNGFEGPEVVDRKGQSLIDGEVSEPIHKIVDQPPVSDFDLIAYLRAHLRYPEDAREDGKEGRAVIQFVVNEDGSISGVEVMRTAGYSSLDAEARRVVAGMPRWKPGRQQGKAVKVYFTLPITFQLD